MQPGSPQFIQFEPLATKGALYLPDRGAEPKIAFLAIHRTANFMSLIATRELVARGFVVLGMNPRSDNNEAKVQFENVALDIKQGVEFLRKLRGVEKVILIGHSGGGGPATTFYQATAEKGTEFAFGPKKLHAPLADLADLPKADALLLLDAHAGNTVNMLRGLNPSVINEENPTQIDARLDPFDPKKGFNPEGHSTYTPEFMDLYFRAQSARMNRLIDKALALREQIRLGKGPMTDDAPFIVYRDRARLADLSMSVHPGTNAARKLLTNDGSIRTLVIRPVRPAMPNNARIDRTLHNGSSFLTVMSFLSANAIRSHHSMDGIAWDTSNNSTPAALREIRAPLLIMAMGGHLFIRDNEYHFEVAASPDKDFIVIDGATHGMTPCGACERMSGLSYSNVTKNLYDYVAAWANERFR